MKTSGYLRLLAAGWLSALMLLGSEHHGLVTFGGLPIPGVAVTATQGDKKVTAITDGMGIYSFPELADGTWSVQVEMSGFTPLQQDVTVAPGGAASTWELKLKPLSEMQAQVQTTALAEPRPVASAAAPAKPAAPAPAKPKPQVQAAAGAPAAAAAPPAEPAPSEANQQAADGFLVNGSQVNGGASPFALNPAFGNNRRGPRSLYTYLLSLNNINTSALNARPFSQTGQATPKPVTNSFQAQGSVQGPLRIPHILRNGPIFFINYALTRGRNANPQDYGLVPTAAEHNCNPCQFPNQIIDPATLLPFPNNSVPVSPQAAALLKLYPMPNFNSTQYNYQIPLTNVNHVDQLNTRVNKQIGRKNSILGTFALQDTRTSTPTLFGFLGTTSVLGMNFDPQWRHQWTQRLSTTLEYQFTRLASHQYSNFENVSNDPLGLAGIMGNDQSPPYYGPPNLSFSSGIAGLTDANPSFNRNQTELLKSDSTWNHGRHTVTFGADFRRQEFNYFQENNPRGSFGFTGEQTGSDFADFLAGYPDQISLAVGNADKYLRQSSYDAYIQDDWRVNSALTLIGGVRWEYQAPITERYGRLVNLDVAPGFTADAPVCGNNDPRCPRTGTNYPSSLMNPDKHGFEPLLGFAWRPISGSSLVVRGSYQLRYSTSVYQTIATQMDQQSPFSNSFNVSNVSANPLTMANGFVGAATLSRPTFAVDPNFKIGYAQNWTLTIQKDLPGGLQMQTNYTGIKGTRLPQEFYPNSYAPGGVNPCAGCPVDTAGFLYETSNGNVTRNAATFQLRRRLHNGFTAQVQYTLAKSIDDTPQGAVQNWLNLSADRGLSSTDQRHSVIAQLQYTSGMGIGGGTFLSGWRAAVIKEWTILIPIRWGTGLPINPNYNDVLGGAGVSGPLRPDFTGAPLYAASGDLSLNPAAFAVPALGQFGNAARDSITGPDQFSLNASLQRTFRVSDRVTLNLRVDSTNTLNHVVFGTYGVTVNNCTNGEAVNLCSPQLGVASNANAMRSMLTTFQFRF